MEKNSIPFRNDWAWSMLVGAMMGLGIGLLLCQVVRAQSLWPTPEIHGTQRDLTHLPQLPMFPMQPDNLQHQMWSQPGVGVIHEPPYFIVGPEGLRVTMGTGFDAAPAQYPNGTHELFQKIITDFERHKIQ